MKTSHPFITLSLLFFCMTACDPGLRGDARIYNDSQEKLTVRYIQYVSGKADTVVAEIPANESLIIQVFSGLGNNSTFDCCPFDRIVSITANNTPIKKKSLDCDSWQIPNKDKLKKFGGEDIKCEFHIGQNDL